MPQWYSLDWPMSAPSVLRMVCAEFDVMAFDSACFLREGINRPTHIASAVHKRQAEFFYGRWCARLAMRGILHNGLPQVGIGAWREPLWPAELIGSITHTAGMAAAMVLPANAGYRGIGLDIEHVLTAGGASAVLKLVATPTELQCLMPLTRTLGADLALTLIFSAKESFFKAVHRDVRRYFGFEAIALEEIDIAAQRMIFSVRETLGPQWPCGSLCSVRFRCITPVLVATLCLTSSDM
jgi:enterobactin synthetase component D